MKIRFNRDVTLTLVDEGCDNEETETFDRGEEATVYVNDTYTQSTDLEFSGGGVCYAVPNDWFTVIN